MNEGFNFLRVVLSIVVGLGITTALNALGKIIKYRASIKVYWVGVLWELGVFWMLLLHWYSVWTFQKTPEWTYLKFLLLLLPSLALYLTSHLAFPEFREGHEYNLEKFYYHNRKYFFGAAATYFVFDALSSRLLLNVGWLTLDNVLRLFGFILVLLCARTSNHRFHAAAALAALTGLILYVFLFANTPLTVQF